MFEDPFAAFLKSGVKNGQQQLAGIVKEIISDLAPSVFDLLTLDNGEIFIEPLLFAYLSVNEHLGVKKPLYPLEQILFGYISEERRTEEIEILSDGDGVVYVPRVGYFTTGLPNRKLKLSWRASPQQYLLYDHGTTIAYRFEDIPTIADGGIEVFRRDHPLLSRLYVDERGEAAEFEVSEITRKQLVNLATAFEIIKRWHPRYYENILTATRKVVIFNCGRLNSFASMSAHGAAFLNASERDDEVFFVEDIAHQCGHVIFNALTFESEQYLAVAPDTPLRIYTCREVETRTVYETLHGIFTEAVMFQCLNACYENSVFSGRQAHELLGRIAFVVRRFGSDLRSLNRDQLFTQKGAWLFETILKDFKDAYEQHRGLIEGSDFSNQPYNFSYERFVELNKSML